jgi:hypothetical protein
MGTGCGPLGGLQAAYREGGLDLEWKNSSFQGSPEGVVENPGYFFSSRYIIEVNELRNMR